MKSSKLIFIFFVLNSVFAFSEGNSLMARGGMEDSGGGGGAEVGDNSRDYRSEMSERDRAIVDEIFGDHGGANHISMTAPDFKDFDSGNFHEMGGLSSRLGSDLNLDFTPGVAAAFGEAFKDNEFCHMASDTFHEHFVTDIGKILRLGGRAAEVGTLALMGHQGSQELLKSKATGFRDTTVTLARIASVTLSSPVVENFYPKELAAEQAAERQRLGASLSTWITTGVQQFRSLPLSRQALLGGKFVLGFALDTATGMGISKLMAGLSAVALVSREARSAALVSEELAAIGKAELQSGAAISTAERIASDVKVLETFGPHSTGPLDQILLGGDVTASKTFRGMSYRQVESTRPIKAYRVYDANNPNGMVSHFWSRTKPTGSYQATLDSALNPGFKNPATAWVEIELPPGTVFFEGVAAPQSLLDSAGNNIGELLGGGNQVFFDGIIPDSWISAKGKF